MGDEAGAEELRSLVGDACEIRVGALGLEAVALPYDAMGALVLLPDPGRLEEVEEALSVDLVQRIYAGMREKSVTLHLPRFELGWGMELNDPLLDLGILDACKSTADFSGISPHPEGLFLASLIHQARIKVDEEGTEAAAVTVAMMAGLAEPEEEPPP